MPNFEGNDWITLKPKDSSVPFRFDFTSSSSSTANNGFLPYGDDISSVTVSGTRRYWDTSNNEMIKVSAPSALIDSSNLTDNVVTVSLTYPGTTGYYGLEFICTLDSGAVLEADFDRIEGVE